MDYNFFPIRYRDCLIVLRLYSEAAIQQTWYHVGFIRWPLDVGVAIGLRSVLLPQLDTHLR